MKGIIIVLIMTSALLLSVMAANTSGNISNYGNVIPPNITGEIISPSHYIGINEKQKITVILTLKYRNQNLLERYLGDIQNPSSPLYHKYMTQEQFISLFSPSTDDYYAIANYFIENGFYVTTFNDRVSLSITGTYSQFSDIFATNFGLVNSGKQFIAPVSSVHYYGPDLQSISNIVGLNNEYRANIAPLFVNSNGTQLLYGSDMQSAYQLTKLYSKGYPTGSTIVTILWAGNDSSGNLYAPFVPSDISTYFNNTLPSNEPKPVVYGYPVGGAPSPGPSAANDPSQANFESTLDLEMAGSTAPGATIVEVYGPAATENYLDEAFAAALNNGSSFAPLNNVVAISNSWGGQDSNDTTWMQYEQEAAARGITVLASSGDDGNTNSASPSFPATMAYNNFGTLAVGGAEMTLNGSPSNNGTGTTGIQSQAVWYNSPQSGDGSQGGVSSVFPEPSWQVSSSMANNAITSNSSVTGVSSGRGTPDLAADGANMSIYITTSSGSGYQELWGTSIASPLMAGVIADMDHYLGWKEGFIDPLIYKLGQAQVNGSFASTPPFYFIYNGSNGAFQSADGYNLAVGWGTMNAYNFVIDQNNSAPTQTNNTTNSSGSSPNPSSGTTNGSVIYAEVNASSSNIEPYSLPESEEFTIGNNSSASINFVVLYLSGSGQISFSIGTSLWASNILQNITVNVISSQLWYNISIPLTSLNGSNDYYLNLYSISGNVSWGYTSSPSVDLNAIQDYYYSYGTLYNDNSYPDIFEIGYA